MNGKKPPEPARGGEGMTKPIDTDVKVLRAAVRALSQSSSPKMYRANLEYLWDRFIAHPPAPKTEGEKP